MNEDIVIDVKNISKKYTIATGYQPDTLREKIVELAKYPLRALRGHHKPKTKEYWALKDISFQVKRGEVLGIIGKNGAGKSTMLKILSRTTEPTGGSIAMHGKVASLLEVGTGFNPELTGRENIYLNGAIIGMTKKEINSKFKDIVSFSGIGEFLDTPVKRYSSGMYVRLAFAVAAHLDSDILLLDEVLAVGDSSFQAKATKKIKDIVKSNRTVIFVSHNMLAIRDLCTRGVYLQDGKVVYAGKIEETISHYLRGDESSASLKGFDIRLDYGSGKLEWGRDKTLTIIVESRNNKLKNWECDVVAYALNGTKVFALESDKIDVDQVSTKYSSVQFKITNPGISAELYLDIGIRSPKEPDKYVYIFSRAAIIKPNLSTLPSHKREDVLITLPCTLERI